MARNFKRFAAVGLLAVGALLAGGQRARADSFSFTTVNYPGATSTAVEGINSSGELVGIFTDAAGYHGFVDNGGTFYRHQCPRRCCRHHGRVSESMQRPSLWEVSSTAAPTCTASSIPAIPLPRSTTPAPASPGPGAAGNQQRWAGRGFFTDATGNHGFLKNGATSPPSMTPALPVCQRRNASRRIT